MKALDDQSVELPTADTVGTARIQALVAAFLKLHPRLIPAQVAITKADPDYRVEVEGSVFTGKFISARFAAFAPADPKDATVLLGPPVTVAIPLPAEPAPMPTLGLDPLHESQRTLALLDQVRSLAEQCRVSLRGVADTEAEEILRLRAAVPLDAINIEGRVLSPEMPLVQLAQQAAETRSHVDRLDAALVEARQLLDDVRPRLRSAFMDVKASRQGQTSLRDLASLANLGQIENDRVSTHVQHLDDLEDHVERLGRATMEITGPLAMFRAAADRHVRAVLMVVREIGLALRVQSLAQIQRALDHLRQPLRSETVAEQACAGLDVSDLPKLHWPSNAEAPILEKQNGERP